VIGTRLTPTASVGSSLSCQLNAAGLHSNPAAAVAANCSSKRSSTNFSTSSDNQDDVNCTSLDVGYVSALDATQQRTPTSNRPIQLRGRSPVADDVIQAFPVGSGLHPTSSTVAQLAAEGGARPTSDHVTRSTSATAKRDTTASVPNRRGRPVTWSVDASDVILSSLNQRGDAHRGIITSTP